ncbi:MAG: LTA synthase family protein, partial [Myxococcales bacterium]|nr:LTA synthase family protein [Myxococcales bacterium]
MVGTGEDAAAEGPLTRARSLLAPPRPGAARYAAALIGPFLAVLIGCKVHKLLRVDPGGVAVGVGLDLVFGVLLFAATAFTLDRLPRVARRVVVPFLHVLLLLATALVAAEHVFFLTTGSLLDAHLVGYTLAHFGALSNVLASEVSAPMVVGGVAIALSNLLPLTLGGRRWLRSLDAPRGAASPATWRSRRVGGPTVALVAVAAAGGALATGTLPGRAEPLRDTVCASLVADALDGDDDGAPSLAATSGAPDGPAGNATDALKLADRAAPPRPNVLIVVMESTRARSTTVYEPDLETTPELVALARRGAVVDTAYTTVTHTTKALTSILCGIYPILDTGSAEAGPEGLPVRCLPRILGKRGYRSAFFQPATAHFERRDRLVENLGFGRLVAKEQLAPSYELSSYFGYEDDALVDPFLDWVRERQGKPFFATVLTLASHHKYNVPRSADRRIFAEKPLLDDYLNAIHYTDRFLGKLLAGLDALGHRDDTVVIVVGDHGEGFDEHGRRQHDTVIYEEGLRVPFVVAGPGIAPGSHVEGLRQLIDVAPTVLDLVGVDVLSGYPGETVRAAAGHERVFASCWYRNRCMAMREGSRKTIYHFDRR